MAKRPRTKKDKLKARKSFEAWRDANPWRYAFNYHKQNARRRLDWLPYNDRWVLSFEEFLAIWDAEPAKKADKEKALRRVPGASSIWEIDRIKTREGYKPGNVRLVTKRINVQLYHFYKRGELPEDGWLQVFTQSVEDHEKSLDELRKQVPF